MYFCKFFNIQRTEKYSIAMCSNHLAKTNKQPASAKCKCQVLRINWQKQKAKKQPASAAVCGREAPRWS